MKNVPLRIYLQVDPEQENPKEFPEYTQAVTWCRDKINDNDVEYILAKEAERERSKMEFIKKYFDINLLYVGEYWLMRLYYNNDESRDEVCCESKGEVIGECIEKIYLSAWKIVKSKLGKRRTTNANI